MQNKYKQKMITKQQSFTVRKHKLTPLYLLGKLKKNSDISYSRQSALSYLEQQQKKINDRYGKIMKKGSVKVQLLGESLEQQQLIQSSKKQKGNFKINLMATNGNRQSKQSLSKIQQLLKKSPRKNRYNSVPKRTKTDASPYLYNQRRRMSTQIQNRKNNPSSQDPTTHLKQRIQKQLKIIKSQIQIEQPTKTQKCPQISPKKQQQNRRIQKKIQKADKIFIHFSNLCKIDSIIQSKRIQKQIIPIIKQYILQEEGDPSQLQTLYKSEQICEIVKKILFLQKILIILTVDLIINRKFKLVEVVIKTAIKMMISFYITVYKDLFDAGKIQSQDLIDIQIQALKKVIQVERSCEKNTNTFTNIFTCIQAKIKSCFKLSKHIQNYYRINHKNIHSFTSNLSYFRLLQFYSLTLLGTNWLSWNIEFLEVCPSPYLHYQCDKKYTLVLDLDETLIHYKINSTIFQGQFLIRPYMFQFLEQMSKYFQLGIFTCSMPEYADLIINHMKRITFRLYRHHTVRVNGQYIKDLSRIGRDLQKMIIVDNLEQNFRLQKMNGIHIRSWYGDRNDDMLKQISLQLTKLAEKDPEDFRKLNFRRSYL